MVAVGDFPFSDEFRENRSLPQVLHLVDPFLSSDLSSEFFTFLL